VDVLSKEQYENIHLSGAVSIPLANIDRRTVEGLKWEEPVIVYCYDYQ
jgi:rhodanese-related sulfurtransferase